MPKKMSKTFYVGSYLGGIVASVVLALVWVFALLFYVSRYPDADPDPVLLIGLVSLLPLIFSMVIVLLCVYRMWAAMQDSYVRTTPGKAAGFLLIPIFNLYWMFHVFHGFAYDYNEYIVRHRLAATRVDEPLFRLFPVIVLCSFIPFVGGVAMLAGMVVLIAVMIKACDAVNALLAAQQAALPDGTGHAIAIGSEQST